jgi:serine/threonine protein kinase
LCRSRLNHGLVVPKCGADVYRVCLCSYILMEFVDGGDMFDHLMSYVKRKKLMAEAEVAEYVMQMASGMDFVHKYVPYSTPLYPLSG